MKNLAYLECKVCLEYMVPPIFQCPDGHTFCQGCQEKISCCPECRSETVNIRNRAMDAIAQGIGHVPCGYENYGCAVQVDYLEKKEHESKCVHRPLECLVMNCDFRGSPDELAAHLCESHGYEMKHTNEIDYTCTGDNVTYRIPPANARYGEVTSAMEETWIWQNQIYACFGKYYVLRIHKKTDADNQLYLSVAVLHHRHHPNKYSVATLGHFRKYSFEGPIWSVRKGFSEIERVRDCLTVPMNIALFLSGGKGSEKDFDVLNLRVTGVIEPSSSSRSGNHNASRTMDMTKGSTQKY